MKKKKTIKVSTSLTDALREEEVKYIELTLEGYIYVWYTSRFIQCEVLKLPEPNQYDIIELKFGYTYEI